MAARSRPSSMIALCGGVAPKLSTECIRVRKQSITSEFKARNGTVGGIAMPEAAGVFNHNRNVTKIGAMPYRWFNADFHGDADDGKGIDAAVAQRDVQGRAFKRRHGDFVEDGFARQWIYLGNQGKSRRVP